MKYLICLLIAGAAILLPLHDGMTNPAMAKPGQWNGGRNWGTWSNVRTPIPHPYMLSNQPQTLVPPPEDIPYTQGGDKLLPLIPPSQSRASEMPGSGPRDVQDGRGDARAPSVPPGATSPPAPTYGTQIDNKKTVLLDFYGDRCEPCKKMSVIVDKLIREGWPVMKVNVNVPEGNALAHRYKVDLIPCFIMLVNKEPVDRVVGETTYERLEEMCKLGIPPPAPPDLPPAPPVTPLNPFLPYPVPEDAEGSTPPLPEVELPTPPSLVPGPRLKPQPKPQPEPERIITEIEAQTIKFEQMTTHLNRLQKELEEATEAMTELTESLNKLSAAAAKLQ